MICNCQLLTMTTDDLSLCKETFPTALHVTGYENEKKTPTQLSGNKNTEK